LHAIRFASEIGAPYVSTVECWWRPADCSDEDIFTQMRQNLRQVTQTAAQYGVGINIQTRGPYSRTREGMQRIMDLVPGDNGEFLGICLDTGDLFLGGEEPFSYLKAVLPKVRHLHLKDLAYFPRSDGQSQEWSYASGCVLGDGELGGTIEECLRLLVQAEWRGVASLQVDGIDQARVSTERLRAMLQGVNAAQST
jgi:inosose dehydratase